MIQYCVMSVYDLITPTPISHLFPSLYIIDLQSSNIPSSFPIILYLIYVFYLIPIFFHLQAKIRLPQHM